MYGISYSGMTQWAAAIARPPHLMAMAPLSCTWNWVDSSTWYLAPGVFALGMAVSWSANMTAWEAERRGVAPPLAAIAEAERISDEAGFVDPTARAKVVELQNGAIRPLFDRRPLRDIEELAELAPWFRDWCDHDDPDDAYWRRISAAAHVEDITLPVLHLTGWYDLFTKGGLDAFSTLQGKGVAGQRLVAGPWNHMGGQSRPDAAAELEPIIDPSPESTMMRFFGRHLKGDHPELDDEPPVRLFVMGENRWRDEHEWPLARTVWTPYHLRGDGSLSTDAPKDERPDSFVYDPADPVRGSMALGPALGDPVDLDAVARRSDVLVYTTAPFDTPVEITGPVSLELWASSSAVSTDFTARLIEVFPDGRAVLLCQGVVRTGPTTEGDRHEIDLWATSVVVEAGHRLRLDVSSSDFPLYDLNPNTGARITHDGSGETVQATQHVFHDEQRPSRLILPIIPR